MFGPAFLLPFRRQFAGRCHCCALGHRESEWCAETPGEQPGVAMKPGPGIQPMILLAVTSLVFKPSIEGNARDGWLFGLTRFIG